MAKAEPKPESSPRKVTPPRNTALEMVSDLLPVGAVAAVVCVMESSCPGSPVTSGRSKCGSINNAEPSELSAMLGHWERGGSQHLDVSSQVPVGPRLVRSKSKRLQAPPPDNACRARCATYVRTSQKQSRVLQTTASEKQGE
ncbi:hypothetical protein RvY_14669 [Ramazzottius varieornatus]|uniref:Uncharacterized protein n=1 Tax=Ramazzottius varieornatus TaxID=947166 RepID=A0A1D1VS60_RAMVA|nr:hypothetical protein RvY_14669 [Ramazzottius varieornatus]